MESVANSSNKITCKGIVQQGPRLGQRCEMTYLKENGYCWKHQRNYEYDFLIADNKIPCGNFFRGCNTLLTEEQKLFKTSLCSSCQEERRVKKFNCQHESCPNRIAAAEQKYCFKHIRDWLRDDQKERNIRYCDIERGCFNIIDMDINISTCTECRSKAIKAISNDIKFLRKKYNIQLKDKEPDFEDLSKKQENILTEVHSHWRDIQKNAHLRALLITISRDEYEKIVVSPCYYCGFYSNFRLNGIDRIDNHLGYIPSNCIPCCKMCNMMKQAQHPHEFLDKANAISLFNKTATPINDALINKWRNVYTTKQSHYQAYKHYKWKVINERNLLFELSEEQYNTLKQIPCYLCGLKTSDENINGIDRVNPTIRAYTIDNCKSCCTHCNVMKGTLQFKDFIEKCHQITLHNCNRDILKSESERLQRKSLRNEYYTAANIVQFMKEQRFGEYIEWCKEKNKTSEYITIIKDIYQQFGKGVLDDVTVINKISEQLELERGRTARELHIIEGNRKLYHAASIYSQLIEGHIEDFTTWYKSSYEPSKSFDLFLNELLKTLPSLEKEDGIEACKKFMYAEKNRRNNQKLRDIEKKVYIDKQLDLLEENIIIQPAMDTVPIKPAKVLIINEIQKIPEKLLEDSLPKQWKVKQIYEYIHANNAEPYKKWCETTNGLEGEQWNLDFDQFKLKVLSFKTLNEAEETIRDFVLGLRKKRHDVLVQARNDTVNPIERDDRLQWPSATILKAYHANKIETFKDWLDNQDGTGDAAAQKRWTTFMQALQTASTDDDRLNVISKFLTARRTRLYRARVI